MIRTQISVDRELYERAKQAARREGISFAELCRRSLAETLSRKPRRKPWMEYVGMFDGQPHDSTTVDEVLYGRASP
ncbi:CopG family transcriptional regulator [Candidatus Palauibacter sp.]|uniref:ribbon-helix-helix domain-containing protein n=1 Tax=Candidatus Palauibacter sp. TaxID=3101350 RepID=UPI003B012B07